jgi:UDP-N-acetylmuramate--alanine ligase
LFASQVKSEGTLIYKAGLDPGDVSCRTLTYSIAGDNADYRGNHITVRDGRYHFSLETPGYVIDGLSLGLPGRHNIENAVAACAAALENGVDPSSLKEGLETYRGVQRRFEFHLRGEVTYIDDYAHHPEEIRAALLSVKELFPEKRITGIFQPHLYSRTRDFAAGFAESLEILDRLYLLDIYPAREEPIPGVTSSIIFDKVKITDKHLLGKEAVISAIRTGRPEVLITLGAGDIDQLVQPLKTLLKT